MDASKAVENPCSGNGGSLTQRDSSPSKYINFKPYVDGRFLPGHGADFLEPENLEPLLCKIGCERDPFMFAFEYCGLRYHLLLEYNDSIQECAENNCLREMYKGFEHVSGDELSEALGKCLDLFWPRIAKDLEDKGMLKKETECSTQNEIIKDRRKPDLNNRYTRKEMIKVQLKTMRDGSLCQISHEAFLNFPPSYPIKNPCPDALLFQKHEIDLLDELRFNVFKAKIRGSVYCLKGARRASLLREITLLAKMPTHLSLPRLVGVVHAGQGNVDQFVIPYFVGQPLRKIRSCTIELKKMWTAQISDAVKTLHKNDIFWGDVHPDNVIIEEGTSRAILIDFGGGFHPGWVDKELQDTVKGDKQGLHSLLEYIDKL